MMRPTVATLFLVLCLSSAPSWARQDPEEVEEVGADKKKAPDSCKKLCEKDAGMDADTTDCETECAVYTDLREFSHDGATNEALADFVADETYNEDGGEQMEKQFDTDVPENTLTADCHPAVDPDESPSFEAMDMNGDGQIDEDEAEEYALKMCVPNEKVLQLFTDADVNQDKVLTKDEFEKVGEDTVVEGAIDEALHNATQGDDEFNPVQSPTDEDGVKTPEVFDEDKSGDIDRTEFKEANEFELHRRGLDDETTEKTLDESKDNIDEAFDKVDTNDNDKIEPDEYMAEDKSNDLGDEMQQSTEVEEKIQDPDDLNRVGDNGGTKTVSMVSHSKFLGQSPHHAGFARAFNSVAKTVRRMRELYKKEHHTSKSARSAHTPIHIAAPQTRAKHYKQHHSFASAFKAVASTVRRMRQVEKKHLAATHPIRKHAGHRRSIHGFASTLNAAARYFEEQREAKKAA